MPKKLAEHWPAKANSGNIKALLAVIISVSVAAMPMAPVSASSSFSGSAISSFVYEDVEYGETQIDISHPTAASCLADSPSGVTFSCEAQVQIKASYDWVLEDLIVVDDEGYRVGQIYLGEDDFIHTSWRAATLVISDFEFDHEELTNSGTTLSRTYRISLDTFWGATSEQATPITVTWSGVPKLRQIGNKKFTVRNKKVFSNGSSIEVGRNFKAPKDGCAYLPIKYRISTWAIPGYYNHAIFLENSRGQTAGIVALRVEEDGYRGTAQLIVCDQGWWLDEETYIQGVKPGKYKISLWEWDDFYYQFGASSKSTITFKK